MAYFVDEIGARVGTLPAAASVAPKLVESKVSPLGTTYEIGAPPLKSQEILRVLGKWQLQATAKEILPETRLSVCCRTIQPGESEVKVWKHQGTGATHYSGLMVCGSVWTCPVCASKISERRRKDLKQGHEAWRAAGGHVYLMTLTAPHHFGQSLSFLLEAFSRARKLMFHRKPWKKLRESIGLAGSVRDLEVTWGVNGWHVHSHEMLFTRIAANETELAGKILAQWQKACVDAGLDRPNIHGTDVLSGDGENGSYVSQYPGKWGMDCELTKSHIKSGRDGNYTPWDFLRMYDQGEAWGDLFREFARAFKGKRQLVWSEGMRELLGLDREQSDSEIASEIQEEAVLLGTLSRAEWHIIRSAEKRGELLIAAQKDGWAGVVELIRKIVRGEYVKQGETKESFHERFR